MGTSCYVTINALYSGVTTINNSYGTTHETDEHKWIEKISLGTAAITMSNNSTTQWWGFTLDQPVTLYTVTVKAPSNLIPVHHSWDMHSDGGLAGSRQAAADTLVQEVSIAGTNQEFMNRILKAFSHASQLCQTNEPF